MILTNNLDPVLLDLGALQIRWYGLLFAIGILLNYTLTTWIFERAGKKAAEFENLAIYLFVGLVLGARLGEVFFYSWDYYRLHPGEIIKIWEGGLASHGAAIGLFIAFSLWIWKNKHKFSEYIDLIIVAMPLTGFFVRLGNYFNSEIVGLPTNKNFGIIFARLKDQATQQPETFPRHPSQLYEAALNLVIFIILFAVYSKWGKRKNNTSKIQKETPPMLLFFLFLGLYFGGRFILEYWKDLKVFESSFPFTMGQVLSIAPVLFALGFFALLLFKKHPKPKSAPIKD